MQVENVSGVSLASRRTAEQQRYGAVSHGVLGQIVVNNQRIAAVIHELFRHGAARVGRDVLHRRGIGRGCGHDGGVLHRAVFLQRLLHGGDGGSLLADGNINADHAGVLLVDDGIHRNRGFAGLAVTDNQFALTAADRNHGVHGDITGLQGRIDRAALDDGRGFRFHRAVALGADGLLAVNGAAQRVHHAAEQSLAHGNGDDSSGALDVAALLDAAGLIQQDNTDVVAFQVECNAELIALKAEQFVVAAAGKTGNVRNAVAHAQHAAGGNNLGAGAESGHAANAPFQLIQLFLRDPAGLFVRRAELFKPFKTGFGRRIDFFVSVSNGQLFFDGSVIKTPVDLHAQAADQRRIHAQAQGNLLPQKLGEFSLDAGDLLFRQLSGSSYGAFEHITSPRIGIPPSTSDGPWG